MDDVKKTAADEISLIDLARVLWAGKWVVLIVAAVVTLGAVVYAFLQKDEFTSSAVIMPITNTSGSALSQYAGLAALAGVNLPTGASGGGEVAAVNNLLASRALRDRLVEALNLSERLFDEPKFDKRDPLRVTEEALTKVFTTKSQGRDGAMVLEVKTRDPQLSFEIIHKALVALEAMLNEYNVAKAQLNISLVESQVREQGQKLAQAQQAMAAFQTRHRLIDPTSQSEGFMQLFQTLTGQRIQLEVQLRQLESAYNASDSRIQAVRSQLDSLNVQLRELERTGGGVGASLNAAPELMIEYQNLFRDLEIAQRLYSTLLASLEQSRLTASQEQVFIRVIDPPLVPDIKSGPNRTMLVLVGGVAGLLLGVLLVFMLEVLKSLVIEWNTTKEGVQRG